MLSKVKYLVDKNVRKGALATGFTFLLEGEARFSNLRAPLRESDYRWFRLFSLLAGPCPRCSLISRSRPNCLTR
jgi:hypothetical protein